MHGKTLSKGTLLRFLAALLTVLAVGVVLAPAILAVPPNGDTSASVESRRTGDLAQCQLDGGTATVVDDKDSAGELVASTIECTGGHASANWTCVESLTDSVCTAGLTVPTPVGPRGGPGVGPAQPAQNSSGQPPVAVTPPVGVIGAETLEQRTQDEISACAGQGGAASRTDYAAASGLTATGVRCTGGGLDGVTCFNTSSASRCVRATGALPGQPVVGATGNNAGRGQATPPLIRIRPLATPAGTKQPGG